MASARAMRAAALVVLASSAAAFHAPALPMTRGASRASSLSLAPHGRVSLASRRAAAPPLRMQEKPGDESTSGDSGLRQLLGVRGGAQTTDKWAIRVQLTKPVTWVPLIWGVACGAAAAGNYHAIWDGATFQEWSTDFCKAIVCMFLAGPLLTGFTQTINDCYFFFFFFLLITLRAFT
ncbi:hypothetical protein T484DRAFT_1839277 [Baffinella frigidus]|nr:hypothetical protein T484DRAFT_1839277 [Cryptophyta sp. CCMP2293]